MITPDEYAYATEVNIATLDELALLKSSSIARIKRQKRICATMLDVCAREESSILDRRLCRVPKLLRMMREGRTATNALDKYLAGTA